MPSNYLLTLKEDQLQTLLSLYEPRNVFDANHNIKQVDYCLRDYCHDKKTGLFFMLNSYREKGEPLQNGQTQWLKFVKLEIIKPVNPDFFLEDYLIYSKYGKNFAKYSEFNRTITIKSEFNKVELVSSNKFALKGRTELGIFNFSGEKLNSFHNPLFYSVFPWIDRECLTLSTRDGKLNKGKEIPVELRDVFNIEKVIKRFKFGSHLRPKALLPKNKQIILHDNSTKHFDIYNIFSNKRIARTNFSIHNVLKTKFDEEESNIAFLMTHYNYPNLLKILVFNLPEYEFIKNINIESDLLKNNHKLLLSDMFDDILEKILDDKPIDKSIGQIIQVTDKNQALFLKEMEEGIIKYPDEKLSTQGFFKQHFLIDAIDNQNLKEDERDKNVLKL